MPIDILNMASKHSQQLIGNKTLLTKQDHEELKRQSNQLDDMRSNLESMAYERVVLDVITRDTISSVKRKGSNMKSTNPAVANKRGFSAPRTTPQNSSKNLSSNNLPVASTGATPSLDDFIPIPSYRGAQSQSQETSNRETQPQQSLSTKRNIPSSQHASVTIGSKSAKMVQGSLPPEIAFLANAPLTDEKIRPLKTGYVELSLIILTL